MDPCDMAHADSVTVEPTQCVAAPLVHSPKSPSVRQIQVRCPHRYVAVILRMWITDRLEVQFHMERPPH